MLFGRLFEDFVPISDQLALITTGRSLNALDQIEVVPYRINDGRVSIVGRCAVVAKGNRLRLGGMFNDTLVYSHDRGVVGAHCQSVTGHQPFVADGIYYTDDWPDVRIYRDGQVFLDHFGEMVQVGNPCWAEGVLYFEARSNPDPKRPDLWEIWRLNGEPERVCTGANPAYWDGKLFVGEWNGRGFDYRCTSVD